MANNYTADRVSPGGPGIYSSGDLSAGLSGDVALDGLVVSGGLGAAGASVLGSDVVIGDVVVSGGLGASGASVLSGDVVIGDVVVSGGLGEAGASALGGDVVIGDVVVSASTLGTRTFNGLSARAWRIVVPGRV